MIVQVRSVASALLILVTASAAAAPTRASDLHLSEAPETAEAWTTTEQWVAELNRSEEGLKQAIQRDSGVPAAITELERVLNSLRLDDCVARYRLGYRTRLAILRDAALGPGGIWQALQYIDLDRAGQHDAERLWNAFCTEPSFEPAEVPMFEATAQEGALGFGRPVSLISGTYVALTRNDGDRSVDYRVDLKRKNGKTVPNTYAWEVAHLGGQTQIIHSLSPRGEVRGNPHIDARKKRETRPDIVEATEDWTVGTPTIYEGMVSVATIPWEYDGDDYGSRLMEVAGIRNGQPTGHGRVLVYPSGPAGIATAEYFPALRGGTHESAYAVLE